MTDFSIEKSINGPVIGLDEVGRGPLAGPVVSCGCLFHSYEKLPDNIKIRDSKKHTSKQRRKLFSLFQQLQKNKLHKFIHAKNAYQILLYYASKRCDKH